MNVSGRLKIIALALIDAGLVAIALALAVYLRFDLKIPTLYLAKLARLMLPAVGISLALFMFSGLYRRAWRYTSIDDLYIIALSVSISTGVIYFYSLYSGILPRSSYAIFWILMLLFVSGVRLGIRVLSDLLNKPASKGSKKNALIVGAGEAGSMVAKELKKHGGALSVKVVGFIDDDASKIKQVIQGVPVLGTRNELPKWIKEKNIDDVIIAMPSAPYSVLQEIVSLSEGLGVQIKTMPGIYEILNGQVNISALKEVDIEDLLRRPPVELDLDSIAAYLTGSIVLVTGAGGSIGSELCRQIAQVKPKVLILLDNDENGIFYTHLELGEKHPALVLNPVVCDIKEQGSLEKAFKRYLPEVVFHAAAHKHVPLMEINTEEAVRNNIRGSKNLIDLAAKHGVKRFVAISTDKAVNPTSVMGATKRVVEIYLQQKARQCQACVFCAVRFGNVLGSQGSVVHLFRQQIAKGGPVTVTDPKMERYFMTIPEAVQLVIQAGALGKGGEIFVLDMGEPVKIMDLARDMIILSGLKPGEDVEIKISGLRPGEKLFEELFSDRENFNLTRHEKIFIAPDSDFGEDLIGKEIKGLSLLLGEGSLDGLLADKQ